MYRNVRANEMYGQQEIGRVYFLEMISCLRRKFVCVFVDTCIRCGARRFIADQATKSAMHFVVDLGDL